MLLLLISGFFSLVFGALILIILNYSIYNWENFTINNLAKQAKTTTETILSKNTVARGFTAVDRSNSRTLILNPENTKNRDIVGDEPNEVENEKTDIQTQVRLFFKKFVRFWLKFRYQVSKVLLSVFRPAKAEEVEINVIPKTKKDNTDSKIKNESTLETNFETNVVNPANNQFLNKNEVEKEPADIKNFEKDEVLAAPLDKNFETNQDSLNDEQKKATINLASQPNQKSEKDMSLFEKLEQKLVENLKEEGLNHYDIWLSLGELYQKYDQNDKAREVYALVMKNAEGELKEKAKNRLVGL